MSLPVKGFLVVLLLSPLCWCQQPSSDLTARTLYYREPPDNDQLPSIPTAKSRQARKAPQTQGAAANAPAQKVLVAGKQSSGSGSGIGAAKNESVQPGHEGASIPGVQHLGLRYNLVLVDPQSGQSEPVDSDRVFQPGECVQLEFEANRSGYLYVLDRASSGNWKPLLPSPEMPDESNIISSRTRVRVPQNYCFKIEGPAGEERVFVVLSRNPGELYGLDESIRSSSPSSAPVPQAQKGAPVLTAENRLSSEVRRMEASMGRRDLIVTKIGQPKIPEEPRGSVYIVNASEVSSDKVETEIQIRHK